MTSNYCRIHGTPMLMKRMNGGWTSVCLWCDVMGKYERIGAHEAVHGYPRREQDDKEENARASAHRA